MRGTLANDVESAVWAKIAECDDGLTPPSFSRERWVFLHAILLVLTALVWLFDESVFGVVNGWYNAPEPLNGEVHQLVLSLAMYGQTLGIVAAIALVWVFDCNRRGRALIIGAALIAVGVGSSTVKMLVGRDRPTDAVGKTIVHGPTKGITQSRHQSFPSGHTATAFALSLCLTRFYPRFSPMAWLLAVGVGFNRIITVRHFPSDVVAGAWIGYSLAAGAFSVGWLRTMALRASCLLQPEKLALLRNQMFDPAELFAKFRVGINRHAVGLPLLALVSLSINLAGNERTWLWDRDEPRFATATREMIAQGEWIVPTFNGEMRPDKPILIYWLMRVSFGLFGDNAFAARFFSAAGGTTACLVAAWLGARMFGRRVGVLAGWMLALSPMLVIESKLATVDAVLLAILTLGHALLWQLHEQRAKDTRRLALTFWAVVGLAVLTKGPVALAIFGLTVVSFCLLTRQVAWLRALHAVRGIGVLVAVVAPWVIAVQIRTGGEFLNHSLGHHVLKRSMVPLENHVGFPGYYLVSVIGLMAPWALLLPWAIAKSWRLPRTDARFAYLAAWALGTLVLFESVRTKLVHYALPAYPALALWLAATLLSIKTAASRALVFEWLGPAMRLGGAGLVALAFVASVVAFDRDCFVAVAVVGALFGGGCWAAGELLARDRPRWSLVTITSSIAAAWIVAGSMLVPVISQRRLVVDLAERLADAKRDGKTIALWQYREPSLIYNLNARIPIVDPMRTEPTLEENIALAQKTGGFICPMTHTQLAKMRVEPRLSTRIVEEVGGLDITGCRFRGITLVEVQPATRHVAERDDDTRTR